MKVIIVGCGKIGTTIIGSLVNEGHDVVAVDINGSVTAEVSNIYDVMCVCGSGTDYETLFEAGTGKAEMFVSVTGSDEFNMLSCYIAKKMGAKHTVARIRNPEYNGKSIGFMKQQLNISLVINPERLAAQELFNILKLPSAVNIEAFSPRNFEMVELKLRPDTKLDGMTLVELKKKYPANFLVCAVSRRGKVYIPGGDFVLCAGDKIGLTAAPTEIQKLLRKLGIMQKSARNVMILGASRMSFYLAKMLIDSGNNVKIIDKDKNRCEEAAAALPGAVIINGDGAEQELLAEEGISSMDAFVALTGMDEENILISFFAASQNVPKAIPKVNRSELASMAENLGLETIISPKRIISDVISRYARALQNSIGSNIETLYKLMDGSTEAIEFNVSSDFRFVDIPLNELRLRKNILIAGIVRGRRAIIPSGDDVIQAGDKVIIIAAGQKIITLSDIMM